MKLKHKKKGTVIVTMTDKPQTTMTGYGFDVEVVTGEDKGHKLFLLNSDLDNWEKISKTQINQQGKLDHLWNMYDKSEREMKMWKKEIDEFHATPNCPRCNNKMEEREGTSQEYMGAKTKFYICAGLEGCGKIENGDKE